MKIADAPWFMHDSRHITVPESENFEDRSVADFLIDLRNAIAHGDARNVVPFNYHGDLAGFTFIQSGTALTRRITLLESDMRRIGSQLATTYCEAMIDRRDGHFRKVAASIAETVA